MIAYRKPEPIKVAKKPVAERMVKCPTCGCIRPASVVHAS